jgi:hypothetical protein
LSKRLPCHLTVSLTDDMGDQLVLPLCLPCLTLNAQPIQQPVEESSFRFIVSRYFLFLKPAMPCFDLIFSWFLARACSASTFHHLHLHMAIHALKRFQLLQRSECGASGVYRSGVTPFRCCILCQPMNLEVIISTFRSVPHKLHSRELPLVLNLGPNFQYDRG